VSAAPVFYFEDVVLDGVLETPGVTITQTHVALFQGLAGLPVDDPDAIPDLLPLCLCTGLGWRVPQPPLAVLAFMSIEWQVLRPARVGDTLRSRSRTSVKRSMREGGIVIEEREMFDQHDQVVQRGRFTFLVAKRPPAARS
jgi:acyl dehydratase